MPAKMAKPARSLSPNKIFQRSGHSGISTFTDGHGVSGLYSGQGASMDLVVSHQEIEPSSQQLRMHTV